MSCRQEAGLADHLLQSIPPVAVCPIAGNSIGLAVGRRGKPVFGWLCRKSPAYLGPPHVAAAERIFPSLGAWAVFRTVPGG
jgi:hypothetical protein